MSCAEIELVTVDVIRRRSEADDKTKLTERINGVNSQRSGLNGLNEEVKPWERINRIPNIQYRLLIFRYNLPFFFGIREYTISKIKGRAVTQFG
jgi:hypothetical protein